MPETLENALNETCTWLMQLAHDDARPAEAQTLYQSLQRRFPALEMRLVWEEEAYSRAVHYDALLRLPGQGTVSLSFCPERAVPWPLRRAHYSRESQIVRVNGKVLEADAVMACLDFLWEKPGLIASLVNTCLIEEALEQRAIELSDAELQQAVNSFRQTQRLFTAAATQQWMMENGITHERLEQLAAAPLRYEKLRDLITEEGIATFFNQHQADYDAAHIARFQVAEEREAERLCAQLRAGSLDFFEAAQQRFLSGGVDRQELFAVVRRKQLSTAQVAIVFGAAEGEVVGPVPSGDGYDIVSVLKIVPAVLDLSTRTAIKEALFDEWLSAQRRNATIEWFWGDARLTNTE